MAPSDVLLRKLGYHSTLDSADVDAIHRLRYEIRELTAGEDFICQGDRPKAAAIVIEGILGRYHTLQSGARQYLALHYPGDWPDAQGLFYGTWIIRSVLWGARSSAPFPTSSL